MKYKVFRKIKEKGHDNKTYTVAMFVQPADACGFAEKEAKSMRGYKSFKVWVEENKKTIFSLEKEGYQVLNTKKNALKRNR